MGSRLRLAAVLAAIVVLMLLLLWRSTPPPRARVAATPATPPAPAPLALPAPTPQVEAPLSDAALELRHAPAAVTGRPLIEGIEVSPKEVCLGRPFAVRIRAKDPDGQDGELVYAIDQTHGNPQVIVPKVAGTTFLNVQAYNLRGDYDQRPLRVEVGACDDQPQLPLKVMVTRADRGNSDELLFTALLPPGVPREGWSFSWDFGDGASARGSALSVTHDYGEREQRSFESSFLIQVHGEGPHGELDGMASADFTNLYALNRTLKNMVVPVVLSSLARTEGSEVVVTVRVRQLEQQPVPLAGLEAQTMTCGTGDSSQPVSLDLAQLSTRALPPGTSTFTLRFASSLLGPACGITVTARGTMPAPTNVPVYLSFGALTRPQQATTALTADRLSSDPAAKAMQDRILVAARLLGRDPTRIGFTVTQAELDQLDAEGKLPPMPSPLAQTAPPPPP